MLSRAIERLKVKDLLPAIHAAYEAEGATPYLQSQLLDTMAELSDPALGKFVEYALASEDARLRAAGKRAWAAGLSGIKVFAKALESGTLTEKRSALGGLAQSDNPKADELLAEQFMKIDPELEARSFGDIKKRQRKSRPKPRLMSYRRYWLSVALGSFDPTLQGWRSRQRQGTCHGTSSRPMHPMPQNWFDRWGAWSGSHKNCLSPDQQKNSRVFD